MPTLASAIGCGAPTGYMQLLPRLTRRFTPALIDSLYTLANRLMSEDAAHFRRHAETNDVALVYERVDTGAPVGFQFGPSRGREADRTRRPVEEGVRWIVGKVTQ